ncbi:MAG: glycogen/starch/alpha-glucan phosphorylase [Elusimicrobiota bacterium]
MHPISEPSGSAANLKILETAMEFSFPAEVLDTLGRRFGAAVAREAAMSTSVGGIGPLLRERVMAQAELGLDVVGVSLLYDTVWSQGWHAWNHLFIQRKPVGEFVRSVLDQTGIVLSLELFDGTRARVSVWKASYGRATVYFLDCPEITGVVYPCQEDAPPMTKDPNEWADLQRLKQSWVVGRGALALAKALDFRPDVITLSETPTCFALHRLVDDAFKKDPFFDRAAYVFNDHTPLEYAHPIWPRKTLDRVKMDPVMYGPFLMKTGDRDPGQVDLTRLLVARADGVYGVSKKHGDVMRAMPSLKDYAPKIGHITNGVHRTTWQAPVFAGADQLSDGELIAAKERLKESLIGWLWRRANLWPVWMKSTRGRPILLWTRRITSYKRLDMLHTVFRDAPSRKRFLDSGVVLLVGGRIYQRDNVSEGMVYNLVELLNKDDAMGERVVFLDNFNVWEAPRLYQAADGAVMLADDGREASATGFMKAQMNAGLVVANSDGAVPEFVSFKGSEAEGETANGFGVSTVNGEPDPQAFLKALEDFSAVHKDPAARAAMMRAALAVTPQVDVARAARDMVEFYGRVARDDREAAAG